MTKVERFYIHMGSLYDLSLLYENWLQMNSDINVISVVYDKSTLLVTYEERTYDNHDLIKETFGIE